MVRAGAYADELFARGKHGHIGLTVAGSALNEHLAVLEQENEAVFGRGNVCDLFAFKVGEQLDLVPVGGDHALGVKYTAGARDRAVVKQQKSVVVGKCDFLYIIDIGFIDIEHIEARLCVAPHIDLTADGKSRSLISANDILHLGDILDPAVYELLGHFDDRVVFVAGELAVLTAAVFAPADHAAVLCNGDGMVSAGGGDKDITFLDILGEDRIIGFGKCVLGISPDIEVIVAADTDGEVGIAVDA